MYSQQREDMKSKKEKLILIGGGGHCKSVIDVLESGKNFDIAGIVDVKEKVGAELLGYKFLGTDENFDELSKVYKNFLITIGHIKSNTARVNCYNALKKLNVNFPVIVSSGAYVSSHSEISEGTVIMNGAIINSSSLIGINCIINTGALIEHDCIIGDHCHISTNSTINGRVRIGSNVFAGSNSVINQEISIADNIILGAGAVVTKNLTEPGIYAGNPAKKLKQKN